MNIEIDFFDLLSPEPIAINGLGVFKKPTAREIARLGEKNYQSSLMFFSLEEKKCVDLIYGEGAYESLSNEEKNELNIFDLLVDNEHLRDGLIKAISFFIVGNCIYDEKNRRFLVNLSNKKGIPECDGIIDKSSFLDFSDVVLQICNIKKTIAKPIKFKDERARKIWEAAQTGKAKRQNANENNALSLENVISKLSTFHNSLNMLNIWDLTVYQIYNQFSVQNDKNQADITAMNYSAWGGDNFDTNAWFKEKNNI